MNMETKNYDTFEPKNGNESVSGSTAEKTMFERGAKAYEQAGQAVSDAFDKTSEKVSETYEKASIYSSDNPGKTILIALGIGVGLGFLLGSSSRHTGVTGRIARPVVNALSDIALDFWR